MNKNLNERYLEFSRRYQDPMDSFLTADTALNRLEILLSDLTELKEIFEERSKSKSINFQFAELEILSYYAVGYVTCLEWHARSRLTDLYRYRPEIVADSEYFQLNKNLIPKAITNNESIATLLTSAVNVSSADKYINIISYIVNNITNDNSNRIDIIGWLGKSKSARTGKLWLPKTKIKTIEEVFSFRNNLVHEIDISIVGHNNIREMWNISTAIEYGGIILRLISGIEFYLATNAPPDFPNLLNRKLAPVDHIAILERKVSDYEKNILDSLSEVDEYTKDYYPNALRLWEKSCKANKSYVKKEFDFITSSKLFENRYIDSRNSVKYVLLKSRIEFLRKLKEFIGEIG